MRHKKGNAKLGKPVDQRIALLRNQAAILLLTGSLNTTLKRAKALRSFVEPLITRARSGTLADIRAIIKDLPNKKAVSTLTQNIVPKLGDRSSGYLRLYRIGFRRGDSSPLVRLQIIGAEPALTKEKPKRKSAKKEKSAKE